MAGSDSQKQLLSLIREFSSEKSRGERRVLSQKKRIEELRSAIESANLCLDEAKREKEASEQENKGYEVELSMIEASIQALEARIAHTNHEIFNLRSELTALETENNSSRDRFIDHMLKLNVEIREFLGYASNAALNTGDQNAGVSDMLTDSIISGQQYKVELMIHEKLKDELTILEKKAQLMESLMKESVELQELSRQTSELEGNFSAMVDQMQNKISCPKCHQDNQNVLDGALKDLMMESEG